jgi:hypothetical protein
MDTINRIIDGIRDGKVVLWAGSGLSKYAGYKTGSELAETIANKLNINSPGQIIHNQSLDEVAEEFVRSHNNSRDKLIEILRSEFCKSPKNISYHAKLAQIPQIKNIITSNWDDLFEIAYGRDLIKIVTNEQLACQHQKNKKNLFKIHGDLDFPQTIIITKSDYNKFYQNGFKAPMWVRVQALMQNHSILFVGYSLEDGNVQALIEELHNYFGDLISESYFVDKTITDAKVNFLSRFHILPYESQAEQFIDELFNAITEKSFNDLLLGKLNHHEAIEIFKSHGIQVETTLGDGPAPSLHYS